MYGHFLLIIMVYLLTSNTSFVDVTSRDSWARLIHKSTNFYQVDTLLYRSEQPMMDDLQQLQQQQINTIINLRFFHRNQLDVSSVQIQVINQPLLIFSLKAEKIANILFLIKNQQKLGHKVLVHCYHGADRTGIVVAMYRIIYQNWTIDDAKAEMIQGGFGYHKFWKHIENLLTTTQVNMIKQTLNKLQKSTGSGCEVTASI